MNEFFNERQILDDSSIYIEVCTKKYDENIAKKFNDSI